MSTGGSEHSVIVLGLGAVGSAALLALARRGISALGLDRHGRAHDRGSSHGRTRITRHAYFEHPDYVPLLRVATAGFERLEADTGVRLLERCGVLLVGAADSEVIAASSAAAARFGVPVESLDAAEVRQRYPAFSLSPGQVGLLEPGAGFVRCEASVSASLDQAERLGATVQTGTRVLGWEEGADGVRVWSDSAEWCAEALVIALGAWTPVLVPALASHLRVTRQLQAWVAPTSDPGPLPCWLVDRPGQRHVYGIPADPLLGDGRCKIAQHGSDQETTADGLDRSVGRKELAQLRATVQPLLPGLVGPIGDASICMYTVSPDDDFIVDRVPGCKRSVVAAGLSGHGFKLAPALGEALADLALYGESRLPIGFLGAGRLT